MLVITGSAMSKNTPVQCLDCNAPDNCENCGVAAKKQD